VLNYIGVILFENEEPRLQQNRTRVHTLVRVDRRTIPDCAGEIRAFMTVRNETLRLPQTLDHYRKLGVGRFFVIDNGSTDGTRELLTAQPDCHVFLTRNSYSEARFGLEWQHALLNEYGVDHWCLVVDADEWFIYPGYEYKSLPELAVYLQQSGAQGVFAFLLDMYGRGTVAEAVPKPQHSMLEVCRYFDTRYLGLWISSDVTPEPAAVSTIESSWGAEVATAVSNAPPALLPAQSDMAH
jgi:glycosyltransferase involved in cell wall biosynthesis